VFANKWLSNIFIPKREAAGNLNVRSFWLLLLTKYYKSDRIKEAKMAGHATCNEESIWIQGFFFSGKPERRRTLGRPRHRCDIVNTLRTGDADLRF